MSHVLYMGDTALMQAGSYLAGILSHTGLSYRYVPSDQKVVTGDLKETCRLFILSDYMASMMDEFVAKLLLQRIEQGAGLLMIGGWESYCGMGGDWAGTLIGAALPVKISTTDDRVNQDQAAVVRCVKEHLVTADLPWNEHPPTVGGFNRFEVAEGGEVLLEVCCHKIKRQGAGFDFAMGEVHPLLVVGKHGKGRVGALATDVAPHWVGPLVDWGEQRINAQGPGAEAVEVGNHYVQFFTQLLLWTGQFNR